MHHFDVWSEKDVFRGMLVLFLLPLIQFVCSRMPLLIRTSLQQTLSSSHQLRHAAPIMPHLRKTWAESCCHVKENHFSVQWIYKQAPRHSVLQWRRVFLKEAAPAEPIFSFTVPEQNWPPPCCMQGTHIPPVCRLPSSAGCGCHRKRSVVRRGLQRHGCQNPTNILKLKRGEK